MAVAIDVGMDSNAADFLRGLKTLGISPERLQAILLTHWHNDHSAGAAFLQREYGVRVYYGASEHPFLTRESAKLGIRGWLARHVPEEGLLVLLRGLLEEAAPDAVRPDRLLADGEIVEGAFRTVATPGHTVGHTAYIHESKRILFCGDALAVVSGKLRLMAKPVTPDLAAARASALRCLRERVEIVCPGHRGPLASNVQHECRRLVDYLEGGGLWPLLG